jgi:ribosome modulation factor
MNETQEFVALILAGYRDEGRVAERNGEPFAACPYDRDNQELERAGWLDGWSRAAKERGDALRAYREAWCKNVES